MQTKSHFIFFILFTYCIYVRIYEKSCEFSSTAPENNAENYRTGEFE